MNSADCAIIPAARKAKIRHRPGVDDVQVTERLPEYQQPQRRLHHANPTGVAQDQDSQRQTDWAERDLALILAALRPACGPRNSARPTSATSGTTNDGAAVIAVKGKGGKERSVADRGRVAVG